MIFFYTIQTMGNSVISKDGLSEKIDKRDIESARGCEIELSDFIWKCRQKTYLMCLKLFY